YTDALPIYNEEEVQRQHDGHSDESPFLAEDGEDEVGVPSGEIFELCLRSLSESLSVDAARTNGDFRLHDLISLSQRIAIRIEEGDDAVLLIRLEQCPADRQRDQQHLRG